MRSSRLAAGLSIVLVTALLPAVLLAQLPKAQGAQTVAKDTGQATIDSKTTVIGKKIRPNTLAAAAVVWRKVPGVIGRAELTAKDVVAKAGLVADVQRTTVPGRPPAPGLVVLQRPSVGDSLPLGSTVTIFVDSTRVDTTRTDTPPNVTVPPSVEVPSLIGASPAVARTLLRSKGLIAGFVPTQLADAERAKVVKQEPAAGRFVSVKSVIRLGLVIDNATTVPNVLTMTSEEVRAKVTDAQLRLAEQQAPDTATPAGRVIAQQPPGGARVDINSTVTVTYSSGPPLARVPNLADNTREIAEATLTRSLFRVGSVDTIISRAGFGRVVWQEPRADSLVPLGSPVRFHIGRQAPVKPVVVPSLIGLTLEEAPARLLPRLRLDFVDSLPSTAPASTIVRQEPAAGQTAIVGSDVHVWTAHPPPPPRVDSVAVPSLIGLTRAEAIDRIGAARLGVGQQLTADVGTPGRISRQEPPAGTREPVNTPVNFWIVRAQQPPDSTTVPAVTNHLLDSALTLLSAARLSGRLSDNGAIRDPDHWAVISQQPVAGTRVRVQSPVRLVVQHFDSVAVPAVIDSLTARAELTLAKGRLGMSLGQRRFAWTLRETVLSQVPTPGASAAPNDIVRVDLSYPIGLILAVALPLVGGGVPAGTWAARKIMKPDAKPDPRPDPLPNIRVEPADGSKPAAELEFPPNDNFVTLSITLDFLDWTFESAVDGAKDPITLDQERTDA